MVDMLKQLGALDIMLKISDHTTRCSVYAECGNAGVIGECNLCDCPKQSRFIGRSTGDNNNDNA